MSQRCDTGKHWQQWAQRWLNNSLIWLGATGRPGCVPSGWPGWLCRTGPPPCWAGSRPVWCLLRSHTPREAESNESAEGEEIHCEQNTQRGTKRTCNSPAALWRVFNREEMCISLNTLHIMTVMDRVCVCWDVFYLYHTHTHTCILATSFFTLSFDDTSTTAAMWPCPLRSLDRLPSVSLADSSLMSATTTEAPSEAKRWHTDRPIPLPPPGGDKKHDVSPEQDCIKIMSVNSFKGKSILRVLHCILLLFCLPANSAVTKIQVNGPFASQREQASNV